MCHVWVRLGKDGVGRAARKGKNVIRPGMVLHALDFLIRSNTKVHLLPVMLPPKQHRKFLWVEKI